MDDDTGAAKPPAEATAQNRALARALRRWKPLDEDEVKRLDRWAKLEAELEHAAKSELTSALVNDGASPERAEAVAVQIAHATALFRDNRERGVDTMSELTALNEDLIRMQKRIAGLSREARNALPVWLRPFRGPRLPGGLFGLGQRANALLGEPRDAHAAFRALEENLPAIIASLPQPVKKKPNHDPEVYFLIRRTGQMWRDAAGYWPSSQITPDGRATAALYMFLAKHSGATISPATWARALRKAKHPYTGGLLGALLSGNSSARPRGPRPK